MTLYQMLLTLLLMTLVLLACFAAILIRNRMRRDAAYSPRWEVGSQICTRENPHDFLPGLWRLMAHLDGGVKVWERIA